MRLEVLGELRLVGDDGTVVDLGGGRQRRVLAALLLQRAQTVSVDRLVDRVWSGEAVPPGSDRSVRTYVSRLRSALHAASDGAGELLRTAPSGYLFAAEERLVLDADELVAQVATAQAARQHGDHREALAAAEAALALVRGEPFGELADLAWLRPEAARLAELVVVAEEERIEALSAGGLHDRAAADAAALSAAHPARSRPCQLRMLALHRAGRQAEALAAFQAFRRQLATDLGLEPDVALVELERRIATDDPALRDRDARPLRGYQLLDRLGEGAFSVVYRGTQPSVGREVAVKQIRAELANRPEFVRRFEAEAHLVARLEHPHVVPLYDFWREPGSAYLVMRLLRGGSLESALLGGPLSVERTLRLAGQVGAALEAAHRAGVVHRDVKSANVLLDEEGNAYLSDFGIAVDAAEPPDAAAALSAGSPAYASPEQLRREAVGPQADVFGLGVTIYEALTGRLPFPDESTRAALLQRQLHDPIPAVRASRSDVPPALDAVLARATAKRPEDRYASVADLLDELNTALGAPRRTVAASGRGAATAIVAAGEERNPYKGLRAFDEADVADFAGRERLVDELVAALDGHRLVAVVGPSGSGKSSVVRAGLLPALRRGAVTGSGEWFVTTMIPGAHPFEELEGALLRVATAPGAGLGEALADGERGIARGLRRVLPERGELLLVVDQFEELFTATAPAQARRFLDALVVALTEERPRLRVVLTLRADFFDRPLRHEGLGRLLREATVAVLPLQADEIERAIVEPALRVGCEPEPGLVSEIVADVADQPGALPLLQYALTELWQRRVSGLLTRAAYRELGGVAGALARRAEELFTASSPEEQAALRRVMGRLVTLGEGAGDTRRRAMRSELGADPAVTSVLARFGDARLLSFDRDPATREPTVEVAHEALLREWPRLRGWLEEDRDGLRLLRHLHDAAAAWEAADRDGAELYRGTRLEVAADWASAHPGALTEVEAAFLGAGQAERDEARALERARVAAQIRSNRRLRMLLGVTAVALVMAVVGAIAALGLRARSERNAELAATKAMEASEASSASETRRLGWEAAFRVRNDRQVGLLLAAEAYRRAPGAESLGALQRVLVGTEGFLGVTGAGTRFDGVAWTTSGTAIGFAGDAAVGFDAATGREVRRAPGPIWSREEYETDSQLLRTAMAGTDASGEVLVVASAARTVERRGWGDGSAQWRHETAADVDALAVSPDGSRVAVLDLDGTLTLLDGATGRVVASAAAHPERTYGEQAIAPGIANWPALVNSPLSWRRGRLAFTNGGAELISGRGFHLSRWRSATGEVIEAKVTSRAQYAPSLPVTAGPVWGLSVEADATTVIVNSSSYVSRFELTPTAAVQTARVQAANSIFGTPKIVATVPLSPAKIAVLTNQGQLVALDVVTQQELRPVVDLQLGLVAAAATTGTPGELVIGAADGLVRWSLNGERLLAHRVPRDGAGIVGLTADERLLVRSNPTSATGVARPVPVLDVTTGERRGWASPMPDGGGPTLNFHANDGEAVVAATGAIPDLMLHVMDPATLSVVSTVPIGGNWAGHAVSWDRRWFATSVTPATGPFRVTLYDLTTGAIVGRGAPENAAGKSMSFEADGRHLVVVTTDGKAVRYTTPDLTPVPSVLDGEKIFGVKFSPDGRHLVTIGPNGELQLRRADTYAIERTMIGAGLAQVNDLRLRFVGDELLFADVDGSARLWDLRSGLPLGDPFPNDPGASGTTADGASVVVTLVGDAVLLWDIDTTRWADLACQAAGRNLTPAEWAQFGPTDQPYRPTCPQWPAAA